MEVTEKYHYEDYSLAPGMAVLSAISGHSSRFAGTNLLIFLS